MAVYRYQASLLVAVDRQIALEQVGDLALRICAKGDGLLAATWRKTSGASSTQLGWLPAQPGDRQIAIVAWRSP